MKGCCGQRSNEQKSQNSGNKPAPINMNYSTRSNCVPDADSGNKRGRHVTSQHDEEVCHGTGERRRDLLEQVKTYLSEFDERPCTGTPPQRGADALRPLGSYPEYIKKHCQSWMPPNPRPPYITSVQTHEIRATSDYDKMKGQTSEYVSFVDATPKPPVQTCDCVKRNGLQDQCPHPMCKPPTAQCKANNPGPCCPPSLGMGGPPAVLGKGKGAVTGSTGTPGVASQTQGPPALSEYQEAFMCVPRGQQQPQTSPPAYTTTYRQDFHDQQLQRAVPPLHSAGSSMPQPHPGMDMICICKNPTTDLPSGKKYLCCPIQVPQ